MDQQFKPSSNGYNNNNNNNTRAATTTATIGFDGTQQGGTRSHGYTLRSSTTTSASSSNMQLTRHVLRATAIALTFIAAIVMGTGKDTARVSITDPTSMKTTTFVETIRPKYSSALVYFIVINVLMFLYSASSLALSFLNMWNTKSLELAISISDLLFLVLLFSSNGAAITTSITIENGNTPMGWIKICDAVSSFCAHVTAAIVLSMLGSSAHFVIVLLQAISLHNVDC